MLRRFWLWIALVVAAGVLVGGLGAIQEVRYQASPRAQAEAFSEEVREGRIQVDDCLDELERNEQYFRAQERLTEELRSQVGSFEAMDPRGVPAEVYADYMEVFERYNASLPAWELRAESLRQVSERCRELTEAHNVRADSLRGLLLEAGLWAPPPRSPLDDTVVTQP
jgi:hypothetical protein